MKIINLRKNLVLFFLGILPLTILQAKDEEYSKLQKKEFDVTDNTQLNLENKYGNIDIMNWDKNLISIEVEVKIRAGSDEKAQKLFDQIDIKFSQTGDVVSAVTVFDDDFSKFFKNNSNKLIDIHYSVYMPKAIPLALFNKYGDVFINELTSTSNIEIKYGNFKANKILHPNKKPFTQIILGYSNAKIQYCTWIKFDIKYSKIELQKSKALVILSKYSKIFIEEGSSLVAESKYDTYRLGKLFNLVATAGYTNFKAEEIMKKVKMDTKYGDLTVDYVPASFEIIKIDNSYGNYRLGIDPSASYKIDGYAKYAKIDYNENAKVNRFNENNTLKVNGIVGDNENTKSEVIINSHYGSVKLNK